MLRSYIKRGITYILHGQPNVHIKANVVELASSQLLYNRTALITGGTSGIGMGVAIAMIKAGAKVVISGRKEERLLSAMKQINVATSNIGNIATVVLDNTDVKSFQPVFSEVLSKFGSIDILVNNAGLLGGDISFATEADWDSIIDTNLKGTFFLCQTVGRYMRDNHIEGNILNIASSSSLRPATSAYTISKWGIRGFTLGLARALAPYNIVVNGLAPGPTATPMLKKDKSDDIQLPIPLGRYATVEEISNMAVILTSGMSRSIMGDTIFMTGGSGNLTFDDVNFCF